MTTVGPRSPAFSMTVIGFSFDSTTSRVMTHSRIFFWPGRVYIRSSMMSSMIIRRPRAPILRAQRRLGDRLERVVGEAQLDVLVLEQPLILPRDGVARLREDLDERRLVQFVQRADDGQAADELRDEAVLDQIFRLDLLDERARSFGVGLARRP